MKILFLCLFLVACTLPPPSGRVIPPAINEPAPEPITGPVKSAPEPKPKKPAHDRPVIAPDKLPTPCDVTQDAGQKQIIETMDCLLETKHG